MKTRLRRSISITIILMIILGTLNIQSVFAATTKIQTAWVISGPGVNITKKGNTFVVDGIGTLTSSNSSMRLTLTTWYSTPIRLPWYESLIQEFDYSGVKLPANNGSVTSGENFYAGTGGTPSRIGDNWYEAVSDRYGDHTVFPSQVHSAPINSSDYDVTITWAGLTGAKLKEGVSTNVAVVSAFQFKSVKEIPDYGGGGGGGPIDPPPDPDIPSEADVSVQVYADDATANYMTFNGTVSASATAEDETNYEDIGDLEELSVDLAAFNDNSSERTGSRSSVSTELTGRFTSSAPWLEGSARTGYRYTAEAMGYVELDDGSPRTAKDTDSDTGNIYMTNDAPSTSLSLTTQNQNGGSVPNGYYYVGVPIDLRAVYSDPEDDINYVQLAIGTKESMDQNKAELIYDTQDSDPHYCANMNFSESGATYSLKNYSSTLTFKNPGTYSYRIYVRDAKSNNYVERDALAQGTFVIRGEPEPPVAIITSPRYAFENEPFKVTQGSTDPNGVDDITVYNWANVVDVTATADPDKYDPLTFKPITPSSSWPGNGTVNGKNGGTITFPTGSTHHSFNIKLGIKDATNLTDNTEQVIKVISDVPVANLVVKDNNGSDTLKENRKITISAENSLAPSKSPILWNESTWTIESVNGKQNTNIKEDTSQRNGNKQRVLQFDKPGDYRITLTLMNQFAKDNPSHEDIAAATYSTIIHVKEDKVPKSEVTVISAKPNFVDNPVDYTVRFRANSVSVDGDKIVAPSAYEWTVYEDYNSDGQFTADEVVPQGKLTFNTEKTEVYMQTKYEQGRHNTIKVVVKTTETFAEPTLTQFLAADGSYKRSITAETTEVINWVPKIVVTPDQGIGTDPGIYNPRPGTPYEDVDLDGDGVKDGKFIRAYTDDTFNVSTIITDEFPETAKVTWSIQKKDHTGAFSQISPDGSTWINSGKVSNTLGHDGGGLRIDSPGIYTLTATVTDDCGDTGTFTLNARIYTLPQAVLETNPNYRFYGVWETKENIRFDLRSDPTIVDDEWGKAWHRMYWNLDCWEITPLERQNTSEIHVMTPEYSGRFNNQSADGLKFIGTNSKLGGITGNTANKNQPYRSMCFTEPGKYEIRYWGTNYGGKVTVPVKYTVNVQIDLPPDIKGSVEPTFYRDPADGNRAKILLSGPYSNVIGRDALTILSNDGDYIDYIKVKVIYDSNNNKLFTDSTDTQWLLNEGSGTTGGLQYILNKINPYGN